MGTKRESGYTFGVNPLLKYRPKHAALLAGISNAWAVVEHLLEELFGFLLASRYLEDRGGATFDPISQEIWDSFTLIDHRIALVRAAFYSRIDDAALSDDFEVLAKRVRRSATSRNTFVHAAWAVSADYPEHIIRTKVRMFDNANEEPTSLKELWKVIDAIKETASAVHGFHLKVSSHVYSRFPLAPPPPEPSGKEITFTVVVESPAVYDPPIFDDLK